MKCLDEILEELQESAKQISEQELEAVQKLIVKAKRIYVVGVGRSGFVARAFANRLMHLGFEVYFVGDSTTPSIARDDLLIIGSGSGTTGSLVSMAKKANEIGADIATLTIFPNATIASLAKAIIKIPGATPKSKEKNQFQSKQPMGNAFEQMSWLIYDTLVCMLKDEIQVSADEMFARHANLE